MERKARPEQVDIGAGSIFPDAEGESLSNLIDWRTIRLESLWSNDFVSR